MTDPVAPAPRWRVHPSRITAALDAAQLFGPRVDRALGGAEPMVDRWESGEWHPTDLQMALLARLTAVPLEWFTAEPAPVLGRACGRGGVSAILYCPPPRAGFPAGGMPGPHPDPHKRRRKADR